MSIQEEKQRRLTVAQENEKTIANNNKKESKRKKKAEKKALEKSSPSKNDSQNKDVPTSKAKIIDDYSEKKRNSNGVCGLLCRVITSLIMWSLFFAFLTIVIFAIFPLYDEQRSNEIFKYMETQTGLPIKQYHHEGIRLLKTFIDKAKLWTNHTRNYLEKTYQEYFLEETSQKKKI